MSRTRDRALSPAELHAFGDELDALRRRVEASLGAREARYIRRISDQGVDELNKQLVEDFARQVITTTRELEEAQIAPADKATLLAQLADAYCKFSKSFSRLNPQYSGLSVALDTLKVIAEYLKKHDPAALRALQPHVEDIGAVLGKRYA